MNAVANAKTTLSKFKNDGRMNVYLSGNHFQQNAAGILEILVLLYKMLYLELCKLLKMLLIVIKIIIKDMVYERSQFDHTITENGVTHTSNGRNVLIFGADMSFSVHATNRANHIYLMGDGLTQGINDTTIYAEKKCFRNFTEPNVKFVLSLHCNGDDSYLFVNGRQELKFKCKTDQLVKEKLCIGNLSDQWAASESKKTGLYGNIYDFVVDYEQFSGVKPIYDMHRYLMIKHNINP